MARGIEYTVAKKALNKLPPRQNHYLRQQAMRLSEILGIQYRDAVCLLAAIGALMARPD